MKRAIFLDRDGVINKAFILERTPIPPKRIEDVVILPGVKEAIKLLFENGFEIVVITNQPDVARGTKTKESVDAINDYLSQELQIKNFMTCFHDDLNGCECRKPKPGMILKAARDLDLDLSKSFMIGDRWRDISAGQGAGCQCYFIDYGYDEKSPTMPFTKVSSLIEATRMILE